MSRDDFRDERKKQANQVAVERGDQELERIGWYEPEENGGVYSGNPNPTAKMTFMGKVKAFFKRAK
jgi:hypothetical protein